MNTTGVLPLYMEQDCAKAVELGAKELDRIKPGWFNHVDIELLDMESGSECVLGQLFAGFYCGLEYLGWAMADAEKFGFVRLGIRDGIGSPTLEYSYQIYEELKECWIGQIADRVNGVKPSS